MALIDMSGELAPFEPATAEPTALVNAEIAQQIATARKYPRSVARARQMALQLATLTEETARRCVYSLPRAGKKIEGPSARLAEIIAASWGNCRFGARVVGETETFIIAQGVFHDLETNAAVCVEVQRRIIDKYGKRFDVDMIGVTGSAACSIALRNAVLKGVPQALWFDVFEAAQKTILGDRKTLAQRRNLAIEKFKAYGVVESQIYAALDVSGVSDIGIEQLATLSGFLTAIEEGADPEDIFPAVETKARARQRTAAPTPPAAAAAPAPASAEAAPAKTHADAAVIGAAIAPTLSPEEEAALDAAPEVTFLERSVAEMIADAGSVGEIRALPDLFRDDIAEADEATRTHVLALIDNAVAQREVRR